MNNHFNVDMGKISLEGLDFFAYHGFYKPERLTGNRYRINLSVWVDFKPAALHDELGETVNYEKLYKIVKREMEKPSHLLEHIALRILEKILDSYDKIEKAKIKIIKFNPPIGGVCNNANVKLIQKRKKNRS